MRNALASLTAVVLVSLSPFSDAMAQKFATHQEFDRLGIKEIVPEELVYLGQQGKQIYFRDASHIVLYEFDEGLNQTGRHSMASSTLSRASSFTYPVPLGSKICYFNYHVQPGQHANLYVKSASDAAVLLLQVDLQGSDLSRAFKINRVIPSTDGQYLFLQFDSFSSGEYSDRFLVCDKNMNVVWDKELPAEFLSELGINSEEIENRYVLDEKANLFVYGRYIDRGKVNGEINYETPQIMSYNAETDNLSYERFIKEGTHTLDFNFTYHKNAVYLSSVVASLDPEKDEMELLLTKYDINEQEFGTPGIARLHKGLLPEVLDKETKDYRKNRFRNVLYELVNRNIHVHDNNEVTVMMELELNRFDNYAFYANSGISMKVPDHEYKLNIAQMDILAFRFTTDNNLKFARRIPKTQQKLLEPNRSYVSVCTGNSIRILYNNDKNGACSLASCTLDGAGNIKYGSISKKSSRKIFPLLKVETFTGDCQIAQQINEYQGIFWSEKRGGEKSLTTVTY